jgi:hypothetical protein
MNSRGLDLLPKDFIKANLIGTIRATLQQKHTERWEDPKVQTGRGDFAEMFGHIRVIYAKTKARRTLLEEFEDHVQSKEKSSEDLISKVTKSYTGTYLAAQKQNYLSTTNVAEINQLLWWLNRIDNYDWFPVATVYPRILVQGVAGARSEIVIATMAYNLKASQRCLGLPNWLNNCKLLTRSSPKVPLSIPSHGSYS